MKILVKNMVCSRCKMVVKSELEKLGLNVFSVELGVINLSEPKEQVPLEQIDEALKSYGFSLLSSRNGELTERVKNLVTELVWEKGNDLKVNLSDYLSDKLHLDYNYISNRFSVLEATTIEKYYINQKIERVKELMLYNEHTLSEIAYLINYSSVAHLSKQFKSVTGYTPSQFKTLDINNRVALEEL